MTAKFTTVVLFASLFGATAAADQLCLTLNGFNAYEEYGLAINPGMQWNNSDSTTYTSPIKAGERSWTSQYGTEVITYCAQLWEGVGGDVGDEVCFNIVEDLSDFPEFPPYPGPMNLSQVGLIEDLYARYIDIPSGHLRSGTALTNGYDYDTAASAFQLVVWEITHENVLDGTLASAKNELSLERGAFRADTSPHVLGGDAASLIMNSLGSTGWLSMGDNLIGLGSETAQDQFMVVPLPVPALLAGIGLLGGVVLRRRIR